jgi:hypothetical protein
MKTYYRYCHERFCCCMFNRAYTTAHFDRQEQHVTLEMYWDY